LGELGTVYKALHETSRNLQWLKILSTEAIPPDQKPVVLDRVEKAARLKNSYILGNSPPELAETFLLIPLDFLVGQQLYSRFQEGPSSLDFALEIGLHTADALTDAHDAGLIHGKLTPGRLFLARNNQLKVAGLPFSSLDKHYEATLIIPPKWSTKPAPAGTRPQCETAYRAPEQFRGAAPSPQTDLFSLGAILYELLTGEYLFQSDSPEDLRRQILERPIPLLKTKRPDLPEIWNQIIKFLLIRDTTKRYPSARELLNDLQQVRWGFSIEKPAFLSKNPIIHRRGFFRRLKPDLDIK
jgi:serine/threonine protein kinase